MRVKIIFPGNLIAKKNSERILRNKKGRPYIYPSAAYCKWEIKALIMLKSQEIWGDEYPINIRFYHYRKTNGIFDFSNMFEGVQDVLQKSGIIAQDDMKHVFPIIDGNGWEKDADNPRAIITIEKRILTTTV